jgi:hypothetical protein
LHLIVPFFVFAAVLICMPGHARRAATGADGACEPCAKGFYSDGGTKDLPDAECKSCDTNQTTYCDPGMALSSGYCFSTSRPVVIANITDLAENAGNTNQVPLLVIFPIAGAGLATLAAIAIWPYLVSAAAPGMGGAAILDGLASKVMPITPHPNFAGAPQTLTGCVHAGQVMDVIPEGVPDTFNPLSSSNDFVQFDHGFKYQWKTPDGHEFEVYGHSAQRLKPPNPSVQSPPLGVLDQNPQHLGTAIRTLRVRSVSPSGRVSYLTQQGNWMDEYTNRGGDGVGSVARLFYNIFMSETHIPLLV